MIDYDNVEYIEYGVAFVIIEGDKYKIQVNRNLQHFPKLFQEVMEHEELHLHTKNLFQDFIVDFKDQYKIGKQLRLAKFMLTHPKSLLSLGLCYRDKGKIEWNYFIVILFLIISFIYIVYKVLTYS